MLPSEISAIDVHGHYGCCDRPEQPLVTRLRSAEAAVVAARARATNTQYVVVSPLLALMPRGKSDAVLGNEHAARMVTLHTELLQWVVINPQVPDTYRQADRMLQSARCVGIKIHPEEHLYHIKDHADEIFSFAAARSAVVLTHTGEKNSMPEDIVPFADQHPNVRVILAHIGNGYDGDLGHQVRAVQASRACNLFTDTSSASSLTPGLIEWAVHEIGADRVLFGTDTPLYSAAMQRVRIEMAELALEHKRRILRDNARLLLRLDERLNRAEISDATPIKEWRDITCAMSGD